MANEVRRHVLQHARSAANHSVRPDPDELMNTGLPAYNRMIVNMHVTAQSDVVGKNRVVADNAVVRYMRIGHQKVTASHDREALILNRADRERAVLANDIVVAYDKARVFARIFLVLRRAADARAGIHHVAAADFDATFNNHVASENGACADSYPGPDEAERTDDDVVGKFSMRVDDRARVNVCHAGSCSFDGWRLDADGPISAAHCRSRF